MKKLFAILSLAVIFSCSKNDSSQNDSGTMMKVDSSADGSMDNTTPGTGATMTDSTSTASPNGNAATPNPSPSTTPSNSSNTTDSATTRR